jgi:WD repeat-containing protein 35
MPNNANITACSWNRKQGYVAAGSDGGLVKIIKLEMTDGKESKTKNKDKDTAAAGPPGSAAPDGGKSGLLMNESLEGHTGEISCITWNESFNKLTTSDTMGKIVVWINYENQWCEEMVNKRDNTIVTGMKWSPDGQHICIIYNDGVVILGSLEGNRIWVKELKGQVLTQIEVGFCSFLQVYY